jgi:hypothetical protein
MDPPVCRRAVRDNSGGSWSPTSNRRTATCSWPRPATAILPDVPTFTEAGMKGFGSYAWYGYFAPAKTPEQFTEFAKAESAKRAEVEKDSGATVDPGCACADCPHAAVRQCGHRLPSRTMAERLGVARRWRFPQRG